MAKHTEIDINIKIWLVEECLAGRMSGREAGRRAGVSYTTIQNWISAYRSKGVSSFIPSNRCQIYSQELKHKVVLDYLHGKGSFLAISEKYKLGHPSLVNEWVKAYTRHKDFKDNTGGIFMASKKSTQEQRFHAVQEYLQNGKGYEQIAQEQGFSYRQIYDWVKKYRKYGIAGLEDRRGERKINQVPRTREEALEQRIAELEHENHLLKLESKLLKKLNELEGGDL